MRILITCSLLLCALCISALSFPSAFVPAAQAPQTGTEHSRSYLGFDRNIYPGDAALPTLRKTFVFTSYWLSPPPGEKQNTWKGKRELLRSHGFGFLILYRGRDSSEFKNENDAKEKGIKDASGAAAAAKEEGFPAGTIIFLDIEEGGRLPETYHVYLRAWSEELKHPSFVPGIYCSGIPVKEEPGVSITTSDDIRNHQPTRETVIWVYNDACPPSPGCAFPENPPPPSASGIPYAAVWQFSQSPRRRKLTARCPAKYSVDGNCYAPGDNAHAWFLDVNSATSPDPSHGAK
ncbi:MAG TPA: glycoside hydrolase domain-containing protein [Candidatus Acidoferrum sp.]|nr:glycoside hydrolase domain-containing protein [Candidatus Acidoferrum sp.]